MKAKATLAFLSSAIAIAGCSSAPKSNEVSAAYVPIAQYNNHTCEQLISEAEAIRRATPALEAAVDKHRSNQTGVELVTWLLFWPAAFALDKGEETSSQLAKAKGELQTVQTALMTKQCNQSIAIQNSNNQNNQTSSNSPAAQTAPTSTQPTNSNVQQGTNMQQGIKTTTDRLKELDNLRKENLITENEYTQKRKDLLEKM